MKAKFNFKIASQSITVGQETIQVPNVDIETEVEASISELEDLYAIQKAALKESPALIEELFVGLYKLQQTRNKLSDQTRNEQEKNGLEDRISSPTLKRKAPPLPNVYVPTPSSVAQIKVQMNESDKKEQAARKITTEDLEKMHKSLIRELDAFDNEIRVIKDQMNHKKAQLYLLKSTLEERKENNDDAQ